MRTAASAPYATRAVILRTRNIGEKDRVVTMLSPEHGKFSAAARGARAMKSKLAAVAQPFVRGRFLLAHGRSLDILTQCEVENAHGNISGALLTTAWATYACELCDAIPELQPDEGVYDLICAALEAWNSRPADEAETVGRWFEARFLSHLGYAPTVGHCVECNQKIVIERDNTQARLAFSPARGGTLCTLCKIADPNRLTVSVQALRVLHRLERRNQAPPRLELSSAAGRELRDVLRRSLIIHLDLKLQSTRFLDDMVAFG
ncbi:MAG: repair protein RecO [Abditibacteriota bacterium]|nr:repair protein RecO [Abditibacteriota bacterium]